MYSKDINEINTGNKNQCKIELGNINYIENEYIERNEIDNENRGQE